MVRVNTNSRFTLQPHGLSRTLVRDGPYGASGDDSDDSDDSDNSDDSDDNDTPLHQMLKKAEADLREEFTNSTSENQEKIENLTKFVLDLDKQIKSIKKDGKGGDGKDGDGKGGDGNGDGKDGDGKDGDGKGGDGKDGDGKDEFDEETKENNINLIENPSCWQS